MNRSESPLRTGFTTGACAAAASRAAALVLTGAPAPGFVSLDLEGGRSLTVSIERASVEGASGVASVIKDSGDDPDITRGMRVEVRLDPVPAGITFAAGRGVGRVTRPGLSVAVGEPAINPGPRRMITAAIRSVTEAGFCVTVSIPGGEEAALRTFNPRLGITGGLSVLGTTGILRPYSHAALRDALVCALDVTAAAGIRRFALVPGNIGRRAAESIYRLLEEQVIEVSNEWGFMLDRAAERRPESLLLLGHPGKLAKLIQGDWDTHSSRSASALPLVRATAAQLSLGKVAAPESETVQGVFDALCPQGRRRLAEALAQRIEAAVRSRLGADPELAVALVGIDGSLLGEAGSVDGWRAQP